MRPGEGSAGSALAASRSRDYRASMSRMDFPLLRAVVLETVARLTGSRGLARRALAARNDAEVVRHRRAGAVVGEGTVMLRVTLSGTRTPDEFVIGKGCLLTNCMLLGHDAAARVFLPELRAADGSLVGGRSRKAAVHIGDQVFIGYGSIVMPGVRIGNRVVVGAGSVVTRDLPDDCVAAGNPAKPLCGVDAYVERCRARLAGAPGDWRE